jgi:dUTP pyrophosphatase
MQEETIQFKKIHEDAACPARATPHSAGFDIYSYETKLIRPGFGFHKISTGVAVQVPQGYYARIAPRSGLTVNHHLIIGAGVVDEDFTGEICVLIGSTRIFPDETGYTVSKGEKIAQLIIEKISTAPAELVTEFRRTYEAHVGYGSTGTGLESKIPI